MNRHLCAARAWLACLAICAATAACRTPSPLGTLSPQAVVIDVPALRQEEVSECGLVALEILGRTYGIAIPAALHAELAQRARDEQGLSGGEVSQALQDVGFETYVFAGALDRSVTGLYHHLDLGRPLIAMSAAREGHNHYEVVIGYDPPTTSLVLLDPVQGRVVRPAAVFDAAWERCGRFTLLALPIPKASGDSP